jgi:hypothetical protein
MEFVWRDRGKPKKDVRKVGLRLILNLGPPDYVASMQQA